MMVTFIEVFTEYLSVMAFMYKAANQRFQWNKTFFVIAIMEYGIVMGSGKYVDNRVGMIMIYSLLFLYAKIKITHNWKPTVRVFGTMLIGIPVMQILVYYVFKDFMIDLDDYRWYGILVNCIIFVLILLWKEKYIYNLGTKITRFKEVFLVILFVLFFFELLLLYKKDGYITTQVQIQALVSVGGLVLVMVLWMSSEMEKSEKQEELKMYELYTKTFEDLITAIRIKQHEFNNHINAIKCLPYTAKSAKELIAEQNRYCDAVLEDTQIVKLLKLESSPVVCGFLYSKLIFAQSLDINVFYEVDPIKVERFIAVHHFIEITGILFDNAVEALINGDRESHSPNQVILRLSSLEDTKLLLEVANLSRMYPNAQIEEFFVTGKSTKGNNRGVGLSRVKLLTQKYKAELHATNQQYYGDNYLSFRIIFRLDRLFSH
ncbi:hypothetical protein IMSAGC011_00121 [Lachnospiraceae bacterium]|nr:hypothetical protein IMSAGC011_00121 [Lachnospiraceae bacterium]